MSSFKENQNKIPALEEKITGLEEKLARLEAALTAEGKSASEILVLLSEMTRLLSEDKHQLNLLLEKEKDLRREQQTSAGRNINFHSHLFSLFPTRFNLFPFNYILSPTLYLFPFLFIWP